MKVFLGSSSESKDAMLTVAQWVEDAKHEPCPWSDPHMFLPGQIVLSRIHEIAEEVDAAILIFGADDSVWYRSELQLQPRDNVLVEYGIFSGVLGMQNVIVCRSGTPRTPTDLGGILYADLAEPVRAELAIRAWLKALDSESGKSVSGVWKGNETQQPTGELPRLDCEVTLTLTAHGEILSGEYAVSAMRGNEKLEATLHLKGRFLAERFLRFDYANRDERIKQFGTAFLHWHPTGDKLSGTIVGFSAITGNIANGSVHLEKSA